MIIFSLDGEVEETETEQEEETIVDPLRELTEEEMLQIVPVSNDELDKAIKQGIRDRELIENWNWHYINRFRR